MEYIAAESLAERLRRSGPLDPRGAVPIIRDVALALADAHDRGIVHRDIKPENILLDASSGRAMVTKQLTGLRDELAAEVRASIASRAPR